MLTSGAIKPRLSAQKFPWSTLEQTQLFNHLLAALQYYTVVTKAGISCEPDVELFRFGQYRPSIVHIPGGEYIMLWRPSVNYGR